MPHTVRSTPTDAQVPEMERCERRIGYTFRDKSLLTAALTHASGAQHRLASNERLEFLGDAILGAVVCELLYRQYPDYLEGDLTKIKSVVVSRQTCAKISEALGLQEFLILGKGMTFASQRTAVAVGRRLRIAGRGHLSRRRRLGGPWVHRAVHGAGNRTGRRRRVGRQLQVAVAADGPARDTARRPPINCSTKKGPTTASASKSPRRSAAPSIRPPGAATRKKPNNAPPATPCPSSMANPCRSRRIDLGRNAGLAIRELAACSAQKIGALEIRHRAPLSRRF